MTENDIFDWVATSPSFDSHRIVPSDRSHPRGKKGRDLRSMYQSFLEYARDRATVASGAPSSGLEPPAVGRPSSTQDDALRFFGKEAEHAALLRASRIKQHAREIFTGKAVEECSGMRGLPVKWLMDAVRERLVELYERQPGFVPIIAIDLRPADEASEPGEQEADPFVLSLWELAMAEMSVADIRSLVVKVKEEMEAAGIFELKWQRETVRKAEKQKLRNS